MKTVVVDTKSIKRDWYVLDATDQVLGRLASKAAQVLTGKKSRIFAQPGSWRFSDYFECRKIKLTGIKAETKSISVIPGILVGVNSVHSKSRWLWILKDSDTCYPWYGA